jgi:hypothetical protein
MSHDDNGNIVERRIDGKPPTHYWDSLWPLLRAADAYLHFLNTRHAVGPKQLSPSYWPSRVSTPAGSGARPRRFHHKEQAAITGTIRDTIVGGEQPAVDWLNQTRRAESTTISYPYVLSWSRNPFVSACHLSFILIRMNPLHIIPFL